MRIIPSVASAPQLNLQHALDLTVDSPALHLDIEDGNFIPNITFGIKTIKEIAEYTSAKLDVHLLTTQPYLFLEGLAALRLEAVCAHIETLDYPLEFIRKVKKSGMKAGLAFNVKTDITQLQYYVNELDYVLLMTSEPDDSGQLFQEAVLEKIITARNILPARISVWVDGGIGEDQISSVMSAGADTAIVGRALYAAENPREAQLAMEQIEIGRRSRSGENGKTLWNL